MILFGSMHRHMIRIVSMHQDTKQYPLYLIVLHYISVTLKSVKHLSIAYINREYKENSLISEFPSVHILIVMIQNFLHNLPRKLSVLRLEKLFIYKRKENDYLDK